MADLPNAGVPTVGRDGLVREYRGVETSELPDPGHRHWSGLWALYPGFQVYGGISGQGGGMFHEKVFPEGGVVVALFVDGDGRAQFVENLSLVKPAEV